MFEGSKISPLLAPTLTRISAALTITAERIVVATKEKSIVSCVVLFGLDVLAEQEKD